MPPMKILVFSDSHGSTAGMEGAVLRELPDRIFHLGDYCRDGELLHARFPNIPMTQVAGNCDWNEPMDRYPEIVLERIEGVTFYLTHGHRQRVKQGLLRLCLAAQESDAQVALFGHTHVGLCRKRDGLILMNPGSCALKNGTYGLISFEHNKPVCYLRALADGRELEEAQ